MATVPAVSVEFIPQHVAVLTIQRPDARNAVNVAVAQALARAVEATEANPDVWAVILTGAGGKAFCAGADIKEVAAGNAPQLRTERGGFAGLVLYARVKPWIAAIDGMALGGGWELALACDMIVASETSVFALPETSRGMLAAAGGLYRLPRVLPRNIALELIATGAQLPATRAHQLGMVNRLAPTGGALAAAVELATNICGNAPLAVRESLKIARAVPDLNNDELQHMTLEAQRRIVETEDYKEGPRAFIDKRLPSWSGR